VTWYELWLFLHISAAIVWIGGAVTVQVIAWLTKRANDPAQAAAFGRNTALVGIRVFAPSSAVVLATGLALTEEGNWDWSEPFIYLGLIGWAAVAGTAFLFLSRAMGRAGQRLATEGPSPALMAEVGRLLVLARVLVLVLFVIVFLMTVKPGT
jgi:uncharacterized membrane protein